MINSIDNINNNNIQSSHQKFTPLFLKAVPVQNEVHMSHQMVRSDFCNFNVSCLWQKYIIFTNKIKLKLG